MSFENEFRWSWSRQTNLDECPRRFYLRSYAFWGGWKRNADKLSKLCYRMSKMQNLDMLAGAVIHEVIAEEVESGRSSGVPPSIDPAVLTRRALSKLNTAWRQSKTRAWRSDPKRNANLFEHYYGLEIGDKRINSVRGRTLECLENFARSTSLLKSIFTAPQGGQVEQMEQLDLGSGPEVLVKLDLWHPRGTGVAGRRAAGTVIYDWKSGRPWRTDDVQAGIYAAWAQLKDLAHPIETRLVYLNETGDDGEARVVAKTWGKESLGPMVELLRGWVRKLKGRLHDPDNNVARPEDFPPTEDRSKCLRCAFFEVCYGTRRMPETAEEALRMEVGL